MSSIPVAQRPVNNGAVRPATPGTSFGRFLLAALYFFLARAMARHGAEGLVSEDWQPLLEQAMLVFLLFFGYGAFSFMFDRSLHPIGGMGFPMRGGWLSEFGLGLATGWGIALFCMIPLLLLGGVALHFFFSAPALGWLFADAAYFLLASLAVEIAFRGYPLQSAIRAIGELPAVLMVAVLYGVWRAWLPGANHATMGVSIVFALLLSMAYLRTRALWLPWGLHFGWVASRALLFGLPVDGISSHSPVVQGYPLSIVGLSGGDFGLDGSWLAFWAVLLAMPILYRVTRDLSFVHNAPVLVPAGIAVDLDAAATRQHEVATRPAVPEVKPLVQILPAPAPMPMPLAPDLDLPGPPR